MTVSSTGKVNTLNEPRRPWLDRMCKESGWQLFLCYISKELHHDESRGHALLDCYIDGFINMEGELGRFNGSSQILLK